MARATQVIVVVLSFVSAAAARTTRPAEETSAIRAEADALLKRVLHKPYGSAMPASPPIVDPKMPKNAVVVSTESTASAALLLFMAGDATQEERYWAAARQLARGLAAAQQPSGRIPATATFGNTVIQREVVGALADRHPTTAALGATLMLLRAEPENETVRRVTNRSVAWLMREQSNSGLWLSFHAKEDGGGTQRILRLDTTDQRDCIVALALAAEIAKERVWRKAAERAVDDLLRVRIQESRTVTGLWRGAYDPAGGPTDLLPYESGGIDVVACRHALEALAAAALLMDHLPARQGLPFSSAALLRLRYEDEVWTRTYPLRQGELEKPVKGPAPRLSEAFKPLPEDVYFAASDFGLPPVLAVEPLLEKNDWDRRDVQDRLALMLVGALRSPLATPPIIEPSRPADDAHVLVERLTVLLAPSLATPQATPTRR